MFIWECRLALLSASKQIGMHEIAGNYETSCQFSRVIFKNNKVSVGL